MVSAAALLLAVLGVVVGAAAGHSIKHVVVLMLENRSFDAMLGHLTKLDGRINGLHGNESNPVDPSDPRSPRVGVRFDAPAFIACDPGHDLHQTDAEIWGQKTPVEPAPMDGFIWANPHCEQEQPMLAYNRTTVPAITFLATEFGVSDAVHASAPTVTQVNRAFTLTGTSHGMSTGPSVGSWTDGEFCPQRTIFNDFADADVGFGIYFSDFPVCLECKQIREHPLHVHTIYDFYDHAKDGKLPPFSWVEPRWFDFLEWKESDQHPPHSTTPGEFIMADVYDALRASPAWNDTLLLVTYDEHGGQFDHVSPPDKNVANPDGINATAPQPAFDFERLGVRVPFVAVSPWINKGSVWHNSESGLYYDHTSIMATMRKLFPKLPQRPLTKREAQAATWEHILEDRKTPRTDCPEKSPRPGQADQLPLELRDTTPEQWARAESLRETPEMIEKLYALHGGREAVAAASPLANDLHRAHALAAWSVDQKRDPRTNEPVFPWGALEDMTVHDGATYVRAQMARFREMHGL